MTETYTGPDYRGRIGFLGGSFNPIHIGHLSVAQQVRDQLALQKVVLVPNNRSPFKQDDPALAPPAHRLAMCKLAIQSLRGLEVSDLEIRQPPPSYSIDSFRAWNAQGIRPVMILGADALAGLPDWHGAADLPGLADFVYVERAGTSVAGTLEAPFSARFGAATAAKILGARVPIEPIPVSSSQIRELIAAGKPVRRFLRGDVHEYMLKQKLYGLRG